MDECRGITGKDWLGTNGLDELLRKGLPKNVQETILKVYDENFEKNTGNCIAEIGYQ